MLQNDRAVVRTITPTDIWETANAHPNMRRSDLFVWMSDHRTDFAQLLSDPTVTWAALAHAFNTRGIRVNGDGLVTAGTARKTWYRVRKAHGDPVAAPPIRAERAKILARRASRRPVSQALSQQIDGPTSGITKIEPSQSAPAAISDPGAQTNPVLERLRETMKKAL
jgi:hypothetical protein